MPEFNHILNDRIESTRLLLESSCFACKTKKQARTEIGELSVTSKMPCKSYSLPSRYCLTGSKLQTVDGSICQFCYGLSGRYAMPTTDNAMQRRYDIRQLMPAKKWIANFVKALTIERFFRWFDNGDLQGESMLLDILTVAHFLPDTQFWLPTKEYKIARQHKLLASTFDNVALRVSMPMINQIVKPTDIKRFGLTSMAFTDKPGLAFICPAYSSVEATCDSTGCRACWNKSVDVIGYPVHTQQKAKLLEVVGL